MPLPAHLQRYDRLIDVLVELLLAADETPEMTMPHGQAKESARHQESVHAEQRKRAMEVA